MANYTDPSTPPPTPGWAWSSPLGQWVQLPRPTVPNPMWSSERGEWISNPAAGGGGTQTPTHEYFGRGDQTPTQAGQNPLQGYGFGAQQNLSGFGVPGFETNPMVGGGSWEGTTWGGAPYSGLQENPIPQSDVTNPNSPYYRPIYNSGNINTGTGSKPGFSINPAVPYQTTWYLQTYGGKKPPYINIHEQMGDALKGIPAAKPSYNWASPQALSQLGGMALPAGWTSMLGFTPGGAKNG